MSKPSQNPKVLLGKKVLNSRMTTTKGPRNAKAVAVCSSGTVATWD